MKTKTLNAKAIREMMRIPCDRRGKCDGCGALESRLWADPITGGWFEFCLHCWRTQSAQYLRRKPR